MKRGIRFAMSSAIVEAFAKGTTQESARTLISCAKATRLVRADYLPCSEA
jgi:hypothetical protein